MEIHFEEKIRALLLLLRKKWTILQGSSLFYIWKHQNAILGKVFLTQLRLAQQFGAKFEIFCG